MYGKKVKSRLQAARMKMAAKKPKVTKSKSGTTIDMSPMNKPPESMKGVFDKFSKEEKKKAEGSDPYKQGQKSGGASPKKRKHMNKMLAKRKGY